MRMNSVLSLILKKLMNIVLAILVLLIVAMIGMFIKLAADSRAMNVPSGLLDGNLRQCPSSRTV